MLATHRVLLMCHLGLIMISLSGCAERVSSRPTRGDSTPASTEATTSSSAGASSQAESTKDASKGEQPPSTASLKPEDLIEMNWNELQSLIVEQKGKIVVLDLWSTSCEPCMKEFPHLVELQAAYPNDVQAISFDLDFVGIKNKPVSYYRERVLTFLGSQRENKILHRMSTTAADELFDEIQLNSIPAVYVFDREGTLAKRFDGADGQNEHVSYADQVVPLVKQLIQSPGTTR